MRERRFAGSRDIPLTEVGREQCAAVARALAGTTVGAVYASEICRAKETAGIAFGRVDAVVPALNLCCIDDQPLSAEQRNTFIEQSLALIPPQGTNTVIVAHGVGVVADLGQGEAAIYRPDGRGGTVRVARVMPDEWMGGVYRPGGARTTNQPQ